MTTERELNELAALLTEHAEALLNLAPTEQMIARLEEASEQFDVDDREDVLRLKQSRQWSPWSVAASVFSIFIAGALVGRLFFPAVPEYTGPPRWITAAVDHTNLYTTETMTVNPLSEKQKSELLLSASRHIEKDLDAVVNKTTRAFFQGGDLMEFEGKRLVQLNFLFDDGTPFALYILRTPETGKDTSLLDTEFRKGQVDELAAMRWARPGYEYFAVGRLTREQMDSIAKKLSSELD